MQKALIISQNFRSEIVYLPRLAQNFSFLQGGQRMYVKKWLALTLAGAVLAMVFSGCDRTIIEHQFHTNTEYITGSGSVSPDAAGNLNELLNLMYQNGAPYVDIVMVTERQSITSDELEGEGLSLGECIDVDDETVKQFVEGETDYILLLVEYGESCEFDSFSEAYAKGVNTIYEKLKIYPQDSWEMRVEDEAMNCSMIIYNIEFTDIEKTFAYIMIALGE